MQVFRDTTPDPKTTIYLAVALVPRFRPKRKGPIGADDPFNLSAAPRRSKQRTVVGGDSVADFGVHQATP